MQWAGPLLSLVLHRFSCSYVCQNLWHIETNQRKHAHTRTLQVKWFRRREGWLWCRLAKSLNERPGKLWNLDPRNSNRTDANTCKHSTAVNRNWSQQFNLSITGKWSRRPSIISWRMAGASLDQARPNAPDTPLDKIIRIISNYPLILHVTSSLHTHTPLYKQNVWVN